MLSTHSLLNNMFLCSTDIFLPTPDSLLVNLNECKEVGVLFLDLSFGFGIMNCKPEIETTVREKAQSPHSVIQGFESIQHSSCDSLPACAGSAEELTYFISKDHGNPVCTGFSTSGWLQAAITYRRSHVRLPDTTA